MNTWMKKLLIVLFIIAVILLAIFVPTETAELDPIALDKKRREAYDFAVSCSGRTPELKFEDITWIILPGYEIVVPTDQGKVRLKGFYSPADSIIYMPQTEADEFWIMVHESLHAIGYRGHPRIPFKEPCRVMADQQY